MRAEHTSCELRGSTFSGEYRVLGGGLGAAVRVRYGGADLERRLGQRAAEAVARDLLRELVVQETIKLKVVAAEKAMGMHGSAPGVR